jgi:Tfp pilus assembly protein PilO
MSAPTPLNGTAARPAPPPTQRFDVRRAAPRLLLLLLAILLLDGVLWSLFVRPRQAEIARIEAEKQSDAATEKKSAEALAQLRRVHDHVAGIQDGVNRFYDEMLATKRDRMVPFQRALDGVGRDFNVRAEKVQVGSQSLAAEGIEAMAFSFPLTAGYENLRQFLARLEEIDQFLIVRQVALGGGQEGGRLLQLSVDVETYFNAPELRRAYEIDRKAKAAKRSSSPRRAARPTEPR